MYIHILTFLNINISICIYMYIHLCHLSHIYIFTVFIYIYILFQTKISIISEIYMFFRGLTLYIINSLFTILNQVKNYSTVPKILYVHCQLHTYSDHIKYLNNCTVQCKHVYILDIVTLPLV